MGGSRSTFVTTGRDRRARGQTTLRGTASGSRTRDGVSRTCMVMTRGSSCCAMATGRVFTSSCRFTCAQTRRCCRRRGRMMPERETITDVRVLVVDDEPLARAGLRAILREEHDVSVVGESGCGAEAIAAIDALSPDLVFMDIAL